MMPDKTVVRRIEHHDRDEWNPFSFALLLWSDGSVTWEALEVES